MMLPPLIRHLKSRGVFRSRFPFIIEPGRCYIRVPQPFLHLGNIRFVIERICRGRRAERMDSQPLDVSNTDFAGVLPHHLIQPRPQVFLQIGDGLVPGLLLPPDPLIDGYIFDPGRGLYSSIPGSVY